MDVDSRKLHVAETLAKATRALEAHRTWMKRRATAVTPYQKEEEDNIQTSLDQLMNGETLTTRTNAHVPTNVHWTENEDQNHTTNRRAPPPFLANQLYLGKSDSSLLQEAATQPVSLGNVSSSNENDSQGGGFITQKHKTQSRKSDEEMAPKKHETKAKRRRKLSQVMPSTDVTEKPQSQVNIKLFVAGNTDDERLPQSRIHNAWGSQSSLENDGPDTTHEIATPREHVEPITNGKNESSQENSFKRVQIDEIQANNPATIIPVSPAPMNQRSTYASHTQSKLMAAEDNVEMLDIEIASTQEASGENDNIMLSVENGLVGDHEMVPEAILHNVLPSDQRNGEAVAVTPILSSLQDHKISDKVGKSHYFISHSSTGETTPTSPMPLASGNENAIPDKRQSSQSSTQSAVTHSRMLEQQMDESQPFSTRVLKDLNLPPLKKVEIGNVVLIALMTILLLYVQYILYALYIFADGREMVKQLPPLKFLQSPLLSPLLNG